MKNLSIFYFDNDLGDFDEFNPRFVMQQKLTNKIVSTLSQKPGNFYSRDLLKAKLKIMDDKDFDNALALLTNISAITFSRDKISLAFPFFTAKDLKIVKAIIASRLRENFAAIEKGLSGASQILQSQYPHIDVKLSLYHLVAGKIFDGLMFDYLEKQQLLKQSFPRRDGRDYMMIGYSQERVCKATNKKLLCSFNNARYKADSLSSFGNAAGNRLDYFRYFKLRQIGGIYGKFKKIHRDFKDLSEQEIVLNSLNEIKKILNNKPMTANIFTKHLQTMRYITKDFNLQVPVFVDYAAVLEKVQKSITESIGKVIIDDFKFISQQVERAGILCLTHKTEKDQLFNELWHLYFGMLNNLLVKNKTCAKPKRFMGEGAYLSCVYLSTL